MLINIFFPYRSIWADVFVVDLFLELSWYQFLMLIFKCFFVYASHQKRVIFDCLNWIDCLLVCSWQELCFFLASSPVLFLITSITTLTIILCDMLFHYLQIVLQSSVQWRPSEMVGKYYFSIISIILKLYLLFR